MNSIPCYKDGVGWKEGLTQGWQAVSRQHPLPQSWGCRSTWTNSPSDEGLSSLTHKEISVSNLIKDLKEESFREDINPAVSTVNLREWKAGVRRTDWGARLPGLDSQFSCMPCVDLEQGSYTL